jgi:hypothetical protein
MMILVKRRCRREGRLVRERYTEQSLIYVRDVIALEKGFYVSQVRVDNWFQLREGEKITKRLPQTKIERDVHTIKDRGRFIGPLIGFSYLRNDKSG